MVLHPSSGSRRHHLQQSDDSVMVGVEISEQDRFVMGDAVPQRPETVEFLEHGLARRRRCKRTVQRRSPELRVIAPGRETNPEAEAALGHDAARCFGLAFLPQCTFGIRYSSCLGVGQRERVEPVSSVGLRQEVVEDVAERDFDNLKRAEER